MNVEVTSMASSLVESKGVLAELTAVPPASSTSCPVCLTWKLPSAAQCENCDEVADALGSPPLPFSLVTLYAKPSLLRDWLTRYKGRPGDEDPWDRASEQVVSALLGRFLCQYGSHLLHDGVEVDNLVVVPSTERRPPHPLEILLRRLRPNPPVLNALVRTSEPIGFRQPNAAAFRAGELVRGRRLYLVDDVYTTGAHLNSAGEALRAAGAEIVGALVLARRVNPHYNDQARAYWDEARATTFAWDAGPLARGVTP